MPKTKAVRGLLDTSVIIDLEKIERAKLPSEFAISAITMAELAAGPHATTDPDERARRQERLQRAEALVDPIPFDTASFRAYGRIYAAVFSAGRKPRGARLADLLIAATSSAHNLALYTRNPEDFKGLTHIITVVTI